MANPCVHVERAPPTRKASLSIPVALRLAAKDRIWRVISDIMISFGEGTAASMMSRWVPGAPSVVAAYGLVDDTKPPTATANRWRTIMRDVIEVMVAGLLSIIMIPTGASWVVKPRPSDGRLGQKNKPPPPV